MLDAHTRRAPACPPVYWRRAASTDIEWCGWDVVARRIFQLNRFCTKLASPSRLASPVNVFSIVFGVADVKDEMKSSKPNKYPDPCSENLYILLKTHRIEAREGATHFGRFARRTYWERRERRQLTEEARRENGEYIRFTRSIATFFISFTWIFAHLCTNTFTS